MLQGFFRPRLGIAHTWSTDNITKDSQIASLRQQLRDMDAQRASIEAQLAAFEQTLRSEVALAGD